MFSRTGNMHVWNTVTKRSFDLALSPNGCCHMWHAVNGGFAFLCCLIIIRWNTASQHDLGPLVTQLVQRNYYTSLESKKTIYIYIYNVNYYCIHSTSCTLRCLYTSFRVSFSCRTCVISVLYLSFRVIIFQKLLILLCHIHIYIYTRICICAS